MVIRHDLGKQSNLGRHTAILQGPVTVPLKDVLMGKELRQSLCCDRLTQTTVG